MTTTTTGGGGAAPLARVIIVRSIVGIAFMQVCVADGVDDDEILDVCNRENPSGTAQGWTVVHRDKDGKLAPITCASDRTRTHVLVSC